MKINLREVALQKKGWSLYKLALELDLPNQSVYAWQNGKVVPSLKTLDKLCNLLGCTIGDLAEL